MVTKKELATALGAIERRFETNEQTMKANHNQVMNAMDRLARIFTDVRDEGAMQYHVNKRHETWIKGLAKHTNYTLNKDA